MIETSSAFAQAVSGTSRRFRARLTIDGAEVDGELRRLTLRLGSGSPSAFAPGTAVSACAEVTVSGAGRTFEGRELAIALGVLLPDESWEYVTLGYFTAGRPAASARETTFFAYGRIASRFAGAFVPPAEPTLENILAALQTQTGVPIVLRGVTAAGAVARDLAGRTCRQVLEIAAGLLGGYAAERNDGAVVIGRYTTTPTYAVDGSRMTALPALGDSDAAVTGVRITVPATAETERQVLTAGTPNLERTDEYMTPALFGACAGNLLGLTWRPGTVQLALGDPRLEPWDVLGVTDGLGRTYALPCMQLIHRFDGGLQTAVTAPGLSSDTVVPGLVGQALRDVKLAAVAAGREARRAWSVSQGKNTVYYAPAAPSGGGFTENDVWFDTDDGDRMYRWDGTAWTAQTFGSGAIAAGSVTAEKLTAGAVTAEKLAAGSVTADKLAADAVTSRNIDLFGAMTVYTDGTLAVSGGKLGYMAGSHGFPDGSSEPTNGMGIESNDGTHFFLVTDSGVRMTERYNGQTYSAYLADGSFRLGRCNLFKGADGMTQLGGDARLNATGTVGSPVYAGTTHVNDLIVHGRKANVRLLGARTIIPASADLNSDAYKYIGCYAQQDASYAVSHAPKDRGAFILDVENTIGRGSDGPGTWRYLRQRLQYLNDHAVWTRDMSSRDDGTFSYGAWVPDRPVSIWDNASAGSSFSAASATITDGGKYNVFFVEIAFSTSYPNVRAGTWAYVPDGSSVTAQPSITWYGTSYITAVYRQIRFQKDSGGGLTVRFESGYKVADYEGAVTTMNNHAIPTRILAWRV